MDGRRIEKMVGKYYGTWWKELIFVVLGSVISTAVVFWLLCLILGNPFTYETDALFFTVTFYGWLDERPYMSAVWIGLAVLLVLIAGLVLILRRAQKMLRPLHRDCDEEFCLAAQRRGIECGRGHAFRRGMMYLLEDQYIDLLCTSRRVDEAREYMESGWSQGKRGSYRSAVQYIDYCEALYSGDLERFEEIAARLKGLGKHKYAVETNRLFLTGDYAGAIEQLKKQPCRSEAARVQRASAMARCYDAMGDEAAAAENYRYAAEHGNTMRCACGAREWLAAHGVAEN